MYKANIFICIREGIKSNEGEAIQKSLHSLEYIEVSNFSIGKYMTLNIEVGSKDEAEVKVDEMCKKLLANIVIEDYKFEITEIT